MAVGLLLPVIDLCAASSDAEKYCWYRRRHITYNARTETCWRNYTFSMNFLTLS